MDYVIANVAKKKGIRSGVVLAGYDLDSKQPTAVATTDFVPSLVGTDPVITPPVGASGSFESDDHKTITVVDGLITSID